MEARLVPLNAVMSLCTPHDLWPSALADVGYAVEGLEVPTRTQGDELVVIDIVSFRQHVNAVLAAEAKSGRSVAVEQARRYGSLDPDGVVVATSITVREPGARSVDSVYVCLEEHQEPILAGLARAEVGLPVLMVSDAEIGHAGAAFGDVDLAAAFRDPIPVEGPPPSYVTLDDQSPDEVFDRVVLAELVAELSHLRPRVTIPTMTEQAVPYFALFGAAAQGRLRRRVDAAARRIAAQDPDSFTYRPSTARHEDASVEVVRQPELVDRRGRTQSYQAIARAAARPMKRRAEIPGQQDLDDLIAELDRASEPNEDDVGTHDH